MEIGHRSVVTSWVFGSVIVEPLATVRLPLM